MQSQMSGKPLSKLSWEEQTSQIGTTCGHPAVRRTMQIHQEATQPWVEQSKEGKGGRCSLGIEETTEEEEGSFKDQVLPVWQNGTFCQ